MGVQVIFDPNAWITRYPEFTGMSAFTAEQYFAEACLYHANDGSGPVTNAISQLALLGMVTAHIAKLNWTGGSQAPSGIIGRISGATEGSVSVQAQNDYAPGTPQWWQQTTAGAAYWAATAPYRTMRYRASPGRNAQAYPWPPFTPPFVP